MVVWRKPPIGWIKLNVDGFYRGNLGSMVGGEVLQNDQVRFQATFYEKFDDGTNNVAELQAMLSRVKLCKRLEY